MTDQHHLQTYIGNIEIPSDDNEVGSIQNKTKDKKMEHKFTISSGGYMHITLRNHVCISDTYIIIKLGFLP